MSSASSYNMDLSLLLFLEYFDDDDDEYHCIASDLSKGGER